jgi:hypothetical protein
MHDKEKLLKEAIEIVEVNLQSPNNLQETNEIHYTEEVNLKTNENGNNS